MPLVRMPVVHRGRRGEPQGIYIHEDLLPWNDLRSYLVLLGYLVQIWAKLCHPGEPDPTNIVRNFRNVSGSNFFDIKAQSKFFQLSRVEVHCVNRPNSANVRFGTPDMVKLGVCAFGRGADAELEEDWALSEREFTQGGGAWLAFAAGATTLPTPQTYGDNGQASMPLTNGGAGLTTGTIGFYHNIEPRPENPPGAIVVAAAGAFGGAAVQRKPRVLEAGISNVPYHFYPVEAISFELAVFRPVDADCDLFYINLDTGVVVDVILYGAEIRPEVQIADAGEAGQGGIFNPMDGGFVV
jgi:hypothetical protein